MQRRMVVSWCVSGQFIGPVFKGQAVQEESNDHSTLRKIPRVRISFTPRRKLTSTHRYALWLTFIKNAVVCYVNWWAVKQTATIRSSTVVCGLHFQQRLRSAVESYPISRSDKDVFVTGKRRPKSDSCHSLPHTSQVKRIRAALNQRQTPSQCGDCPPE